MTNIFRQVQYPRGVPLKRTLPVVAPKNDGQTFVTPKPPQDLPVPRKKLRAKYPKGFHVE